MRRILVGLWLTVFIFPGCGRDHDNIAMYVNHEPISVSEMEYWMLLSKAEVYSYFFREYSVDYSPDFWMESFGGGESPLEMLKNVAINRLVKSKVQQLLARDLGVIENIGFDALMDEKSLVNKARKKSMAKGEPIYGPPQFNTTTYFDHVFDKMVHDTKQKLLREFLSGDARKFTHINIDVSSLANKTGFEQMQLIEKAYESIVNQMVTHAELIIIDDAKVRI